MIAAYFKEMQGYDVLEVPEKGFLMYRQYDKEIHFGHMYVKPQFRREGIAQQLATMASEKGKELGCEFATCIVSLPDKTTDKATRLVRIYLEFGFLIVELVGNSQIIMKKDLI